MTAKGKPAALASTFAERRAARERAEAEGTAAPTARPARALRAGLDAESAESITIVRVNEGETVRRA